MDDNECEGANGMCDYNRNGVCDVKRGCWGWRGQVCQRWHR